MNTFAANICLLVTTLLFFLLFSPVFHHKISTSNDQGASGYMIIITGILHLVILLLIGAAYVIAGRNGYLNWISAPGLVRTILISSGLLSCVMISAISIISRFAPGHHPAWLEWMGKFAPALILIVVVGTGFVINNSFLRDHIPFTLYKWPWLLVNAGGIVAMITIIVCAINEPTLSPQEATRQYENAESIKNSRLAEIDSADVSAEFNRLLEFTGDVYPTEVIQKATAKILTDSAWEKRLIGLLENDQAPAAFNFLYANEVRNKNAFLQSVMKGAESMAEKIRHDIQGTSPSAFPTDMFTSDVTHTLRTIEKFEGMGINYLPVVKAMRSALDEHGGIKKIKFDCIVMLDEWISARQ